MKKVLILEDEKCARDALVAIVKKVDESATVYDISTEEEAYAVAVKYSIDLFMLDIILKPNGKYKDSSGADFAQNIRNISKYRFTPIIFLTSLYDEKLNMYKNIHCYQYFEKPYDYSKVEETVRQAIMFRTTESSEKLLFYRCDGILQALPREDIIYAENKNNRLHIITARETRTIPYKSLRSFIRELDSEQFLQCSRTTVVNVKYIKSIDTSNRYIYVSGCDKTIEIGTIFKKSFLKELKESVFYTGISVR